MQEASDQLTLWLGDSPARTSLSPAKVQDSPEPSPASGLKCSESSGIADPVGSLLKTCLLSELAVLTPYSKAWRDSGTPLGRSWWVLTTAGDRNDASESLSWPTPTATPYGSNGNAPGEIGPRRPSLQGAVEVWPTPTTGRKHSSGDPIDFFGGKSARDVVMAAFAGPQGLDSPSTNGKNRGRLNSRWVAQLMGFPPDWCELPTSTLSAVLVTASRQSSRK
jgi:hypothetical protein